MHVLRQFLKVFKALNVKINFNVELLNQSVELA